MRALAWVIGMGKNRLHWFSPVVSVVSVVQS
jgi:hypothetical protein